MAKKRWKLGITSNSKNIPDDIQDTIMTLTDDEGIVVNARHLEDFPMPWDAWCTIEDGFFVLTGSIGPSGGMGGTAVTKVPQDKVSIFLDLYVNPVEGSEEELKSIFTEYGWSVGVVNGR